MCLLVLQIFIVQPWLATLTTLSHCTAPRKAPLLLVCQQPTSSIYMHNINDTTATIAGQHIYIAETENVMADHCIWLWHLMDEQLLTHFDSHYPQSLLWQHCTLWPEMNSALLPALPRKWQPLESFLLQQQRLKHGSGLSGWESAQSEWYINPIQDHSTTHTSNYLVAFAHKVHTGKITPSGKPCRLGNVETTLHTIGQTIALLGPNHHDPRLQPNGKLIFALKCQFHSCRKEDPPPTCVEPLPIKLIKFAVQMCCASNTEKDTCIANMITIGFFMLCHSAEHTVKFFRKPFKLSNIQFYKDDKPVPICLSKMLHTADILTLTFDMQKNCVKSNCIGHRCTTSGTLFLILAVAHQVAHRNPHKAMPNQPLCSYYHSASSSYLNLASQNII